MEIDTQKLELELVQPTLKDGGAIHELIGACPPLDLNSSYAYNLLSHHFAGTCVLAKAKSEGAARGYVSAYLVPGREDTVFVWQVAVHAEARGQGLAGRMLKALLEREACAGVRYLETTISPSNEASIALFGSFARKLGTELTRETFMAPEDFGSDMHEAEDLYRIGPMDPAASTKRAG